MKRPELRLKDKFRILAGIVRDDTLATLYIPKSKSLIELKYIPSWFEKLKYKVCGFELRVIRQEIEVQKQTITEKSFNQEISVL